MESMHVKKMGQPMEQANGYANMPSVRLRMTDDLAVSPVMSVVSYEKFFSSSPVIGNPEP